MNADTVRSINEITKNGYYRQSTTLGAGGWAQLAKTLKTYEWLQYKLYINDHEAETIKAENSEIAISAFHELYILQDCDFYIVEVVTTINVIQKSEVYEY